MGINVSVDDLRASDIVDNTELLSRIFLDVPLAVILYDANGDFVWSNNAVEEIFGADTALSFKGINLFTFPLLNEAHAEQLHTGNSVSGENLFEIKPVERTNVRTIDSNDFVYISSCIEPLMKKETSTIIGYVWFIEDLTRQKKTELELRKNEEHYINYYDNAPNPVFTIDLNNIIQSCNKKAEYLLGVFRKDLIGMNFFDLFYNFNLEQNKERSSLQNVRSGYNTRDDEFKIQKSDGTFIWVSVSIAPFFDDTGRLIEFHATLLDITNRKDNERVLIEAKKESDLMSKAKSDLMSVISHEIRTPMTSIVAMTELLENIGGNQEQKECYDVLKEGSQRLMSLLSNLLDVTRIEYGGINLKLWHFNLVECIEKVERNQIGMARQKSIGLTTIIDENVPTVVYGDSMRLERVLSNLVNNALKFTDNGQVTIAVHLKSEDSSQSKILFEVTDTGIGIPVTEKDNIFKMFWQKDISATRSYGGAGLGLSVAKYLVERMGGFIWFESEEGKGSVFSFVIKFEKKQP